MSKGVINEAKLEVDTAEINRLFAALSDNKDRKAAIKSGLRKSGNIIKKQTVANMTSVSSELAAMKKDVHVKVYKNSSGVRVDILDYRKANSKAFILKFFELGTKERYTRHPRAFRGTIGASYFFKKAVDAKLGESERSLQANIIKFINRKVAKNAAKAAAQ